MSQGYDEIQPSDNSDTDTAVENTIAKRAKDRERELRRESKARVRELMRSTEAAFAGEIDLEPTEVLDELQELLEDDPDLHDVLAPGYDGLESWVKVSFKKLSRLRERWRAGDDVEIPLVREYRTYIRVAIALGHIHAATDMTRYAPVHLEKLDVPGARSPIDGEPTPIGRVRVAASSTEDLEDRATEIPHKDCEHILAIANPREGKDSLISRIAGNLKDEHGYKWVSLHDDGRFETSMLSIPNDEEGIQQSLESFDQDPKGYPTKVYVPAVGLPDRLPANHVPFTFGVDSLTTETVAQLSGVQPEGSTERRIKHALREVQDGGGSVDELIRLLEKYADETSAEITVTELRDDDELEDEDVDSETRTYQLGEDKVLRECAQSLMMLASEGLLRDAGAETNLDMTDVLEDQEHAAALNCNFLPDGDEHLKYLVENIWLRLIFRARDDNPWLPRVAVEIREIKELAPSTLDRAKYSKIVKALRQTLFFLSSQGGSRRVLLLGSTQYLNDVYKPVRGNMPLKVLLKMGDEKIRTLESAGFVFKEEEKHQLKTYSTGWGMLLMPDGKTYPINWTGARCGLSLGDLEWINRYGLAMGFRVQLRDVQDVQEWRHDAARYYTERGELQEAPPDRGEWYLLEGDVRGPAIDNGNAPMPDDLEDDEILEAARRRQEYPIDQDLRPVSLDVTDQQRQLELVSTEEAEEREANEVFQRFDVHGVLREWSRRQEGTVGKFTRILETIQRHEISSYSELADLTGVGESSIKQYMNQDGGLEAACEKDGGAYHLTPVGRQALEIPWSSVFSELD